MKPQFIPHIQLVGAELDVVRDALEFRARMLIPTMEHSTPRVQKAAMASSREILGLLAKVEGAQVKPKDGTDG